LLLDGWIHITRRPCPRSYNSFKTLTFPVAVHRENGTVSKVHAKPLMKRSHSLLDNYITC